MSSPPDLPGVPTARFMMDGILHNIARKQRLKGHQSPKQRPLEQGHSSPRLGQPISASDESPENPMTDYFTSKPSHQPRKGILKSPTVHFPEELGSLHDEELSPPVSSVLSPTGAMGHSLAQHNAPGPELPPPPPPVQPLPAPPPPPPVVAPQPPTLFDRAIEADEYLNEAAYKLYTKFIDELSEFVDKQGDVIRIRLAVQEKRQELKRLRENVSQCDMLLIDYMRQCMTHEMPSDDATLISYFEASQTARDQVGPVDAEYEPMEIGLGAEEHQLKEKYAAIEGRFEHFFRLNATSTTKQSIPSKIEYEASTAPSASGDKDPAENNLRDPDLFHGTFIGDNVEIGQLPLRADDESTKIQQEQDDREILRKPTLSSDTQDHSKKLRSSATGDEAVEDNIPTELLGIAGAESTEMTQSQEIESRDRRISQSLKGVASHTLFDLLDDHGSLPDELPDDSGLQEGDSLLLLDEHVATQSILSEYLISFENTRDRVNRWMLHQLRVSPREIYALRRQVTDYSPGVPQWPTYALSEWSNDLLGHGQAYHQGSIEDESDSQLPHKVQSAPFPDTLPYSMDLDARHRPYSSSVSNAALAPTVSDLHNRSISTPQRYDSLESAFNTSTLPLP